MFNFFLQIGILLHSLLKFYCYIPNVLLILFQFLKVSIDLFLTKNILMTKLLELVVWKKFLFLYLLLKFFLLNFQLSIFFVKCIFNFNQIFLIFSILFINVSIKVLQSHFFFVLFTLLGYRRNLAFGLSVDSEFNLTRIIWSVEGTQYIVILK